MASFSPYQGLEEAKWADKTDELINSHPLKKEEMVEVVLQSWNDIFDSRFGPKGFQIGKHIFPKPQIMGFLLHEMIPLEFAERYKGLWRGDLSGADKDLVYISDSKFSVEIKTSSNPKQIFGNRSYAQEPNGIGKKDKSGYYLTVNFGKCQKSFPKPLILLIKFGWLDHTDWVGQAAATGQQAHLIPAAAKHKLQTLYTCE